MIYEKEPKILKDDKKSVAILDNKKLNYINEIELQGEVFYVKKIIKMSPYYNYYIENLLERKHLIFLFFYDFCNKNKTRTAELLGISRQNIYLWEKENEDFKMIMYEKSELSYVDKALENLEAKLEEGDWKATELVLKSKGGFKEKTETESKSEVKIIGFNFIDAGSKKEEYIDVEIDGTQAVIENNGV